METSGLTRPLDRGSPISIHSVHSTVSELPRELQHYLSPLLVKFQYTGLLDITLEGTKALSKEEACSIPHKECKFETHSQSGGQSTWKLPGMFSLLSCIQRFHNTLTTNAKSCSDFAEIFSVASFIYLKKYHILCFGFLSRTVRKLLAIFLFLEFFTVHCLRVCSKTVS